ncbi:hypothetical protein DIU31_008760 [Mucilaginibacter rubeus]|uniref:Uncharacterized protein n=2 Tax=Mucilaginibacter TaxID=423349 RepID=A0AAE6JF15_9SPHI|nr:MULTISPECIES: hypothetical protein [Mucilaginibacter]QEM03602.1 hypothetical protein DIU31_008760 [Mucilaginibacter rubeus]QEM16213.1 hypothetical protein DIU38_008850 [Mucilaginibacter gossypii]QTE41029.1 hypothetical protein J3L19_18910 [Mucilaginibacter rubeus]QTE47632.1 hypothetical protein J3L21_18890 [Mucilaginibacter rubeus]QTE59024.1 hypothetical protein J3L23_10555 [Mucilaginibacter rubeus]
MKTNITMKLVISVVTITILSSCEKAIVYNGNVNVMVQYNQQPVPDIPVYYYAGMPEKDNSGNITYQGMQLSAIDGSVTFRQLPPGQYHFTASGFLNPAHKAVGADTDITVRKRYRDESNYQILLPLR